ncbi:hypothetical protein OGH69_14120 [Flavobacterium sp. MFBS3-15]|uniref:hypothetical protein n=1 Tax=Flavobacterium sp. MFBS3-15 TaxID=2989816 RepID=UPI002235E456|nr:hypothetical protein [Flavobacterium sp. MFBS3-15]MCW4470109.1 hypothetical protein [Flavobacterium sp. MFBS3-15]
MKKEKSSKERKHQTRKQDVRKNILEFVLSAIIILALFFLNSINRGIFLNDGYFYLFFIIAFLISGAYFFTASGKISNLSFSNRFLASAGVSVLVWGVLNAYNIYYSKTQPLKEEVVKIEDIGLKSGRQWKVTLYFDVEGTSNTYSGSGLDNIPINEENRQSYRKRLKVKLAYRKGILGSYILSGPIRVIK